MDLGKKISTNENTDLPSIRQSKAKKGKYKINILTNLLSIERIYKEINVSIMKILTRLAFCRIVLRRKVSKSGSVHENKREIKDLI